MNLKKYKWPFYVFTFFLVSFVALVVKEITPGKKMPAVAEGLIIVAIFYGLCFLGYKVIVNVIKFLKGKRYNYKNGFSIVLVVLLVISVLINFFLIANKNLESNLEKTENKTSATQQDNFEKKVSCSKYFQQIISDLEQKRDAYFESESTSALTRLVGYKSYLLGFYSPKLDTCLYAVQSHSGLTFEEFKKSGQEDSYAEYIIYDALTGNKVTTFPQHETGKYGKYINEYSAGEIKF